MPENFFQQIKDEPLTKELAQKIMEETKGEARGTTLKMDWGVILQKKGEEGIKKLEEKMKEVGVPIKYEEIKAMGFYPLGLDIISILAFRDLFGFTEKDVQEMGSSAIKTSLFFKIILKYFSSIKLISNQIPRFWREHYTVGDLKVVEINEKEKYLILRIENFNVPSYYCAGISGAFIQSLKMMLNCPVTAQETKCTARGDDYHEFILKWK